MVATLEELSVKDSVVKYCNIIKKSPDCVCSRMLWAYALSGASTFTSASVSSYDTILTSSVPTLNIWASEVASLSSS